MVNELDWLNCPKGTHGIDKLASLLFKILCCSLLYIRRFLLVPFLPALYSVRTVCRWRHASDGFCCLFFTFFVWLFSGYFYLLGSTQFQPSFSIPKGFGKRLRACLLYLYRYFELSIAKCSGFRPHISKAQQTRRLRGQQGPLSLSSGPRRIDSLLVSYFQQTSSEQGLISFYLAVFSTFLILHRCFFFLDCSFVFVSMFSLLSFNFLLVFPVHATASKLRLRVHMLDYMVPPAEQI